MLLISSFTRKKIVRTLKARIGHAAALYQRAIYIIGGTTSDGYVSDVIMFDIATS